jgi:hypothetical protein
LQKYARVVGWLLLAAAVFVTLCPIGLRPVTGYPLWLEHSAAYAVLVLVFSVGYPCHRLLVLILTILAAGAQEAAQALEWTRHGRLSDFYGKAIGCAFGWMLTFIAASLKSAHQRFQLSPTNSSLNENSLARAGHPASKTCR